MERQFLTESYLREKVPAIYSGSPVSSVSERYTFVPTFKIISHLKKLGWLPTAAKMNKNKQSLEYGQHMIRFARKDSQSFGDSVPELIVVNSHDRTKRLFFGIGVFRAFCTNGMVVFDESLPHSNFVQKHMNVEFSDVENIMKKVVTQFNVLASKVKDYKTIQLTEIERNKFAYVAKEAHWGKDSIIDPKALLEVRRVEDKSNDLWTVFNRIQENVTKGGIHYSAPSDKTGKIRKRTTRTIKNVSRDIKINQALWMLMAAFAVNRKF
jgi:hypothetical protein